MRNPNGLGGISKLSGKRRRPYWARVTTGWEINDGRAKQIYATIGYFATRKEAVIALANHHANPTDLTKKGITFGEVFEIWSKNHFKKYPSTEATLTPVFNNYCQPLHNMSMETIRTVHLQNILNQTSNLSKSTQHKIKSVMVNVYKYCLENDIIQKDYSQFAKLTSETESKENYFTKDDLRKIMKNNPDDVLLVLLHTVMRIGELLNVKREHIHLEKRYIEVHGTKTKNAHRIVPIHKDIVSILERSGEIYLFENSIGNKLAYKTYVNNTYKPFMERLGLCQTPHATRHTFISLMDGAGVNKIALKRIVGHSNQSTTEHYTHKSYDDLIEAIDKLKIL